MTAKLEITPPAFLGLCALYKYLRINWSMFL